MISEQDIKDHIAMGFTQPTPKEHDPVNYPKHYTKSSKWC